MNYEKVLTVGDFEFGVFELKHEVLNQHRAYVSNDKLKWNYWLGSTEDSPGEAMQNLCHYVTNGFGFYGVEYEGIGNIHVKTVINGGSFLGYEFLTNTPLTIGDHDHDVFRLEERKDQTRILVASHDSYYISDDVTKFFNVPAIQEQVKAQMDTGEPVDATEDYYGFMENEIED
jgi:hypothetical protein